MIVVKLETTKVYFSRRLNDGLCWTTQENIGVEAVSHAVLSASNKTVAVLAVSKEHTVQMKKL